MNQVFFVGQLIIPGIIVCGIAYLVIKKFILNKKKSSVEVKLK